MTKKKCKLKKQRKFGLNEIDNPQIINSKKLKKLVWCNVFNKHLFRIMAIIKGRFPNLSGFLVKGDYLLSAQSPMGCIHCAHC
ncbi:hypothetical protein BpHYR1_034893 [Brachionus plicatilis]|uniref:Uncharacterized protein n=1 Tax=Brachionus plicatilis TaxID=10195 RepID=A0A3M7TBP2_BRAPC|nr:hypothetical protein BpHYR1_034893 [Brachionus plicatilis]